MNRFIWIACIVLPAGYQSKKDISTPASVKPYKDSLATAFFQRQKGWIAGDGDCINTCVNGRMNPDYNRLKAIRVPLSMLKTPSQ